MKLKKKLVLIISAILISIPTGVFAWLAERTYYACNEINSIISIVLTILALSVGIGYITAVIRYIKKYEQDKKQKIKNIVIWLIISIIQIIILLYGARWVRGIGIEQYSYATGKRFQVKDIDIFISNCFRTIALISVIGYVTTGVVYFIKSEKHSSHKIINLVKGEIITIIIFVAMLFLAKNW